MNSDLPEVSVIIPVFNCEKYLSESIGSVIFQTYKNWEIIVVDDGSIDRSSKILDRYKNLLSSKIKVIVQERKGPSTARNRAISASSGEYIAFLDCDDIWLPEKLEKQIEFLEQERRTGLLYSDCYIINGSTENRYSSVTKPHRGWTFNRLLDKNFIPTSTVVIKKQVLDEIGLFDLDLWISQDYDLWLRIARTYRVDFIDQPLTRYRVHDLGISRNVDVMIDEDLGIMEYWVKKIPDMESEVKDQIRKKKARLHYHQALYNYHARRVGKAFKSFMKSAICRLPGE